MKFPRILFVDDDAICRFLFQKTIGRTADVTIASSVRDALQCLAVKGLDDFDIIVTDYNMPGATGIDLLLAIHQHNPRFPVIFQTASPEVYGPEALNAGAYACLPKGIPTSETRAMIDEAISCATHCQDVTATG